MLSKPQGGEKLYVYLPIGHRAVSSLLLREDKGGQLPIYYASKLLRGAELAYSEVEKVGLALVTAARKLRPYFLSHTVVVRTNYPLRTTLGKMDSSGRMMKWAVELGQYAIEYEARTTIKAQALGDFIQEATHEGKDDRVWSMFVDRSSTIGGSGAGVLIINPEGEELEYAVKLDFKASNNEAEYEAVLHGLDLASGMGIHNLQVHSDSRSVVQQISEEFQVRDERMIQYVEESKRRMAAFPLCTIMQIPR